MTRTEIKTGTTVRILRAGNRRATVIKVTEVFHIANNTMVRGRRGLTTVQIVISDRDQISS